MEADVFANSVNHIHQTLSCAPQITRLCAAKHVLSDNYSWQYSRSLTLPWACFELLASTAGSILAILDSVFVKVNKQELLSPSIFGRFSALRSLTCNISTRFQLNAVSISSHFLSTLEPVRSRACHSSLLDTLSYME